MKYIRVLMLSNDYNAFLYGKGDFKSRLMEYRKIFDLTCIIFVPKLRKFPLPSIKMQNLEVLFFPVLNPLNFLKILKTLYELMKKKGKFHVITAQDPLYLGALGIFLNYIHRIPLNIQLHADIVDNVYWIHEFWINKFFNILARLEIKRAYRKGPEFLIKAIPLIKKSIPNMKCIIVGEGPQKSYLQSLAKNLGLSNDVIFTGSVPSRNVPKYLAIADVLVVSSVVEEFVRILIEGMACKKPIIASEVGGIPEVASNYVVARLIPPKSPEAIARAVIEILSDKTLSDRFAENGYTRVMKLYSQQIVAKRFIEIVCKKSRA